MSDPKLSIGIYDEESESTRGDESQDNSIDDCVIEDRLMYEQPVGVEYKSKTPAVGKKSISTKDLIEDVTQRVSSRSKRGKTFLEYAESLWNMTRSDTIALFSNGNERLPRLSISSNGGYKNIEDANLDQVVNDIRDKGEIITFIGIINGYKKGLIENEKRQQEISKKKKKKEKKRSSNRTETEMGKQTVGKIN
jgi:hypothetical protein